MDDQKRQLQGSEKRDIFKRTHKDLSGRFYACDADFCLVSKYPPGTVAYLDYKAPGDSVTFSECIQYNEWIKTAPVFIIEGRSPDTGPFKIFQYFHSNWKPRPPEVNLEFKHDIADWKILGEWEDKLRKEYHRCKGWNEETLLHKQAKALAKRENISLLEALKKLKG